MELTAHVSPYCNSRSTHTIVTDYYIGECVLNLYSHTNTTTHWLGHMCGHIGLDIHFTCMCGHISLDICVVTLAWAYV